MILLFNHRVITTLFWTKFPCVLEEGAKLHALKGWTCLRQVMYKAQAVASGLPEIHEIVTVECMQLFQWCVYQLILATYAYIMCHACSNYLTSYHVPTMWSGLDHQIKITCGTHVASMIHVHVRVFKILHNNIIIIFGSYIAIANPRLSMMQLHRQG